MSFELSIIIPIYNSEIYLKNCLDSICKQLNDKVEIILIDDCSSDKSAKICKTYLKNFNNIKLITLKKNKGVSEARNIGIGISSGNFISFVDSDDMLLPGSVNNILKHIKIYNDYKVFIVRNFVLKKEKKFFKFGSSSFIPNEKKNSISYSTNCWNFVIQKKFIDLNKVYFKKLKVTEDWVFIIEILSIVKKFKIITKPVYMHRMYEPNSLGKKAGYLIAISRLKVICEIGKIISKKNINLNQQKINLIKRLLIVSNEQMNSNLILCNFNQIKIISKYLNNSKKIILQLSKFGFKSFNKFLKNKNNTMSLILKFKLSSSEKIKKTLKENINRNVIIFCAGGYGRTALKILLNLGANVVSIIDNNPIYYGKKIEKFTINNPLYLKKNIKKYVGYQIFICNKNNLIFSQIKSQLKNIGIKNNNMIHFNI